MMWCAAIARLQFEIEQIGDRPVFELEYQAEFGSESSCPEDLKKIEDSKLIRVSCRLGVVSKEEEEALEQCRDRRNNCAHPSGVFVDVNESLEYAQTLSNVLITRPARVPWNRIVEIIKTERVKLTDEQAEHIVSSIAPMDKTQEVMNQLLSTFLSTDNFEVRDNIRRVWPRLGEILSPEQRTQLMKRLARELARFQGVRIVERDSGIEECPTDDVAPIEINATEVADLIFWQDLGKGTWYQKWIYEYLVSEYERFATERAGRGIDVMVLRQLYEYAPDEFRDRCENLREIMLQP